VGEENIRDGTRTVVTRCRCYSPPFRAQATTTTTSEALRTLRPIPLPSRRCWNHPAASCTSRVRFPSTTHSPHASSPSSLLHHAQATRPPSAPPPPPPPPPRCRHPSVEWIAADARRRFPRCCTRRIRLCLWRLLASPSPSHPAWRSHSPSSIAIYASISIRSLEQPPINCNEPMACGAD
jgi:hypothetical protein